MFLIDKITGWLAVAVALFSVIIVVSLIASLFLRSDDRQAEIDAQSQQSRTDARQRYEAQGLAAASRVVGELYYIQDSRTGLCFAVRSVYRHGYLSVVDCAEIPASMLHVTNTTQEE
jgi:hypothetical protein